MKGSQIHFWAKMGLGKFGWGKNGTGQIWVGANLALGKFGFRANLAGQTWSRQTWPGQKWLDTHLGISFFVKLNNSRRIPSVVTTRYLKMGPSSIIGSQNNGGPKHGE